MMKKTSISALLLSSALVLSACSDDKKEADPAEKDEPAVTETETENSSTEENTQAEGTVDKSETAESDEELKDEIADMEGIQDVHVIITEDGGGFVLIDLQAEADMTEADGEKIADDIAKKAKEKYPEHKVDVQLLKNNEVFVKKTEDE